MFLPDEQDERGFSAPVIYTIVTVSALVLIILIFVFLGNDQKSPAQKSALLKASPTPSATPEMEFAEGQEDIEALYKENKLRSEDLDFWDMYQQEAPVVEVQPTPSPTPTEPPELTDEQKAQDGKHILVSYKDGTQEWLEINEDIPLHEYDFTKMKAQNNQMAYYEGNKQISRLGIILSEESGKVDFEDIKSSGVDFVMLKVGARGYETGVITPDAAFTDYAEKATQAGLKVGVVFYSQAVTIEEATEEAEFVSGYIRPYEITYPVAFCMETITYDVSRTDILDEEKKTQITEAFLTAIKKEGYTPVIYGSRDYLLTEIIPEGLLVDYEVWLTDFEPVPDYPYQFKMWEYANGESVYGVEEPVSYTISFVDYTKR